MKILIDSDILVYKVAYSVETPIYVVKGGIYKRRGYAELMAKKTGCEVHKRVNVGTRGDLKKNLVQAITNISEDVGGGNHKHFLTSSKVKGNFRKDIGTIMPYKGNRVDMSHPFYYNRMRQILHDEYGAMLVHGQEADDAITIENHKLFKQYGNYEHSIICTIDKDFKTTPGTFYNFTKRTIEYVTEEQALKNFYRQLLYGDATDNIPGLTKTLKIRGREEEANKLSYSKHMKKFDEDTANESVENTFNYVREMYMGRGLVDEFWEIGNLLWLRRYEGQIWSDDMKAGLIK